ncbi:MAG: hypothetical protein ACK5Y2_04735 [Bdellovibrionales bacterium]
MRGLTLGLLALLVFSSAQGVASPGESCFQGTESLVFLDVIKKMNLTPRESLQAVTTACREVDPSARRQLQARTGILARSFSNASDFVAAALYGPAAGAFSRMNATESQRSFRAGLERIKLNPNRYERLRDAIKLTLAYPTHPRVTRP